MTEDKTPIFVRCFSEDKPFFVENKTLEEYLTFKHRVIIRKQEDLMRLIKIELEENMQINPKKK